MNNYYFMMIISWLTHYLCLPTPTTGPNINCGNGKICMVASENGAEYWSKDLRHKAASLKDSVAPFCAFVCLLSKIKYHTVVRVVDFKK